MPGGAFSLSLLSWFTRCPEVAVAAAADGRGGEGDLGWACLSACEYNGWAPRSVSDIWLRTGHHHGASKTGGSTEVAKRGRHGVRHTEEVNHSIQCNHEVGLWSALGSWDAMSMEGEGRGQTGRDWTICAGYLTYCN